MGAQVSSEGWGASTTATEVAQHFSSAEQRQSEPRLAVITGATSGMAQLTACTLAAFCNFNILLACPPSDDGNRSVLTTVQAGVRSLILSGEARPELETLLARQTAAEAAAKQISVGDCDLVSYESVTAFAAMLNGRFECVDVLVNAAEVFMVPLMHVPPSMLDCHMAVNHLGHFWLTNALLGLLSACPNGSRVITVSNQAHLTSGALDFSDLQWQTRPYSLWHAFAQSKTANILFAFELNRRFSGRGIMSVAIDPGQTAERNSALAALSPLARRAIGNLYGKSPAQAAATCVYAALAPGVVGGMYYSDCTPVPSTALKPFVTSERDGARLWEWSVGFLANKASNHAEVLASDHFTEDANASSTTRSVETDEQALINAIDAEQDVEKRKVLLEKLETILIEESFIVGLESLDSAFGEKEPDHTVALDDQQNETTQVRGEQSSMAPAVQVTEAAPKSLHKQRVDISAREIEERKRTNRMEIVQTKLAAIRLALEESSEDDEAPSSEEDLEDELLQESESLDVGKESSDPENKQPSQEPSTEQADTKPTLESIVLPTVPSELPATPEHPQRRKRTNKTKARHHHRKSSGEKDGSSGKQQRQHRHRTESPTTKTKPRNHHSSKSRRRVKTLNDNTDKNTKAESSCENAVPAAPAPPSVDEWFGKTATSNSNRRTPPRVRESQPSKFTGTALRRRAGELRVLEERPTQARRRKNQERANMGTLMRNWGAAFARMNSNLHGDSTASSCSDSESWSE